MHYNHLVLDQCYTLVLVKDESNPICINNAPASQPCWQYWLWFGTGL